MLGLSVLLLAGIWWWGSRRSGQAPGNSELRESSAGRAPESVSAGNSDPHVEHETRDWGVPPLEPLNIRTDDYDHVPVLEGPMMVQAGHMELGDFERTHEFVPTLEPLEAAPDLQPEPSVEPTRLPPSTRTSASTAVGENSDRFSAPPPPVNSAERQKIVTIRVCGVNDARWSGSQLMTALESHGLSFGRYQVFHRKHTDGRSLFCVASLIEPGTFDIASMPEEEFRGVTLFAVLPGPIEPLETIDELFATAAGLAEELSGAVQDSKGMLLSPQRASGLREEIARFQAQLRQD